MEELVKMTLELILNILEILSIPNPVTESYIQFCDIL